MKQNYSIASGLPVYLDFAATTPVSDAVADIVMHYMKYDFGNSGSRTHVYGTRAKTAVGRARRQIAAVVGSQPGEVVFTSGATESNNLAILGLRTYGESCNKKHIISTSIEHKSVLEPLELLRKEYGFEITLVDPDEDGTINLSKISDSIRPDTLLVSVMHANNETGVIQPIDGICDILQSHEAFLHVDAAQTFGKLTSSLNNDRIDLISISAHKVSGPMGIGALVGRNKRKVRTLITPIMVGGGQENKIRPGTLPVPLIAGFGLAAEQAALGLQEWHQLCTSIKDDLLETMGQVDFVTIGDQANVLASTICISFPGIDAEALFVSAKDIAAFSNGSACTSEEYSRSHVLKAMGINDELIDSSIRMSWCSATTSAFINPLVSAVRTLQS